MERRGRAGARGEAAEPASSSLVWSASPWLPRAVWNIKHSKTWEVTAGGWGWGSYQSCLRKATHPPTNLRWPPLHPACPSPDYGAGARQRESYLFRNILLE